MSKIDLINEINLRTCNKFNFLRLKQVFYDKYRNMCSIQLIYPYLINLTEDDKDEIVRIIKEILFLKEALFVIKINKSYPEADLIRNDALNYLKNKCPVFYGGIIEGCYNNTGENINKNKEILCGINTNFSVEVLNNKELIPQVKLNFICEENLKEYFYNYGIDKKLIIYLNKLFCANFCIKICTYKTCSFDENFLKSRIENLKTQSEIDSILKNSQDKYIVNNKRKIVGEDINFNPRYISSIKEPMEICCLAGKINFLQEKTYKSKRTKKNKETGEEERIEKPYFNFTLKDNSNEMHMVIFPSKANYHKMHLLKNGDCIIVEGKIEKFNDKLEMMVKKISLCDIPSKNEIPLKISAENILSYRFVKPIKYVGIKQSNLFNEANNLSREILSHTFVVYDFETTGVDPLKDEIIEIGALKIVNGVFTEAFSTLIKPKKAIPFEATKINKITNDMVKNAYSIEQVLQDFYLFCKDCQMVGYNSIAFDSLFLNKSAKEISLFFDNTQIDVFLLAKQKLKGLRNYKLGTVAEYLKVDLIDAHRALNDVVATAEVFLKLY